MAERYEKLIGRIPQGMGGAMSETGAESTLVANFFEWLRRMSGHNFENVIISVSCKKVTERKGFLQATNNGLLGGKYSTSRVTSPHKNHCDFSNLEIPLVAERGMRELSRPNVSCAAFFRPDTTLPNVPKARKAIESMFSFGILLIKGHLRPHICSFPDCLLSYYPHTEHLFYIRRRSIYVP